MSSGPERDYQHEEAEALFALEENVRPKSRKERRSSGSGGGSLKSLFTGANLEGFQEAAKTSALDEFFEEVRGRKKVEP